MTGAGVHPGWQEIAHGRAPTAGAVSRIATQQEIRLGSDGAGRLRDRLHHEVLGLGPLEPLVADRRVTDVLVNGTNGVWVDRGGGLEATGTRFADDASVRRLAVRLAGLAGQRLDDACPYVDGVLSGGIRLHAILPPLVTDGPHLSLRVPRRTAPDLPVLREWGMVSHTLESLLRDIVHARLSFVVGGGTGTGKTTLLGAMLHEVGSRERVVVVEDVRELATEHPHVVRLQGRAANVEGRGAVGLTDLVRQSLRMRPDRLVIGEVRGAEVRELLTALNTGHQGGCGTVHANACPDVVTRFEALGALAGLDVPAVHAQLGSAVQLVIHLDRATGPRRVREVALLRRAADGRVDTWSAVRCTLDDDLVRGPAWATLQSLLHPGPTS